MGALRASSTIHDQQFASSKWGVFELVEDRRVGGGDPCGVCIVSVSKSEILVLDGGGAGQRTTARTVTYLIYSTLQIPLASSGSVLSLGRSLEG